MHEQRRRDEMRTTAHFRPLSRIVLASSIALLGAILGPSACLDRPLCSTDCVPQTTDVFVDKIQNETVDKIDLLFMIDNSSSMKDKQDVLKDAVPDLVRRLVAPNCVDAYGVRLNPPVPYGVDCPSGYAPEFHAITDIHIGVVTSSLGDHGAGGTCPATTTDRLLIEEANDNGELLGARPRSGPGTAPPFTNLQGMTGEAPLGFLNWHPAADANGPAVPGEAAPDALVATFQAMVSDADQQGCGFEAQLESWYRFLVDPAPPQQITLAPCLNDPTEMCAQRTGLNTDLLRQRAAFLRPDSLLAVIMLSDENDCSIRDDSQAYLSARRGFQVPNGTDECASNPDDPCCYSCGLQTPAGCKPKSEEAACQVPYSDIRDNFNLRCFDQKRRFGADFLYPTQRYVNALSRTQLCTSHLDLDPTGCPQTDLVPNPIYTDLSNKGVEPRSTDLVFLAGIHGVPWQDIQATTDPNGMPYPSNELHYKTAAQMATDGTWATILGDVNQNVDALDPLMQESTGVRGGTDPVASVGQLVSPTNAPRFEDPGSNPANGHEWNNVAQGDLEYACIFQLASPRDDSAAPFTDCNGRDPNDDNPLCQNSSGPDGPGKYGTTQYFAKGYPGLRELQVLKDFGKNGIVASICARNLDAGNTGTSQAQDYGYRPAVDAIVDRLKAQLAQKCLPRQLTVDANGTVPCNVVEASTGSDFLGCDLPGACEPGTDGCVPKSVEDPARAQLAAQGNCTNDASTPGLPSCQTFHFCGVKPAGDDCHNLKPQGSTVGWCYIDPENNARDDTDAGRDLVKGCDVTERRLLRFVGDTPAHGAVTLIACEGAPVAGGSAAPTVRNVDAAAP